MQSLTIHNNGSASSINFFSSGSTNGTITTTATAGFPIAGCAIGDILLRCFTTNGNCWMTSTGATSSIRFAPNNTTICTMTPTAVGISTSTPAGRLSVLLDGTGFNNPGSWGAGYALFGIGAGSSTGSCVGILYNSASNFGSIICLTPGLAFRDMNYVANSHTFRIGDTYLASIDGSGNFIANGSITSTTLMTCSGSAGFNQILNRTGSSGAYFGVGSYYRLNGTNYGAILMGIQPNTAYGYFCIDPSNNGTISVASSLYNTALMYGSWLEGVRVNSSLQTTGNIICSGRIITIVNADAPYLELGTSVLTTNTFFGLATSAGNFINDCGVGDLCINARGGAIRLCGNGNAQSGLTISGTYITSTYTNRLNGLNGYGQLHFNNGSYNLMQRQDGGAFYILIGNGTDAQWNSYRPFYITLNDGVLYSQNGQRFTGGTQVDTLTTTNTAQQTSYPRQVLAGSNGVVSQWGQLESFAFRCGLGGFGWGAGCWMNTANGQANSIAGVASSFMVKKANNSAITVSGTWSAYLGNNTMGINMYLYNYYTGVYYYFGTFYQYQNIGGNHACGGVHTWIPEGIPAGSYLLHISGASVNTDTNDHCTFSLIIHP